MFSRKTKPNVFKSFLFCAIAIFSIVVPGASYAQVTKQNVKDLVLKQLLVEKIGKVDVYISKDIVQKKAGLNLWKKQLSVPYTENWIFFVDEKPFANWEHPCSYIFVDQKTGQYKIIKEKIHPAVFNEYELISYVKRPEGAGKIPKSTTPVKIQSVPENENLYAVIINAYDWLRYWNDISAMYCTLIDVYGFSEDNIFILYEDGLSDYGDDFNNDGVRDIRYRASKYFVQRTFRNLSGEWTNDPNVPELGPDDQLFVFTEDHGGHNGTSSYLYLEDSYLYPYELADYVENINCASMIFVMEQCFSGGFVDDIMDTTGTACKHRVIHTACGEYEESYAEVWISYGGYNEFVFYWTAAARGYYPYLNRPWITNEAVGSFDFDEYFESHPEDYDPDVNTNGKVQMQEAFVYANDFDSWSPTGYFNPYEPEDEYPITNNQSGF